MNRQRRRKEKNICQRISRSEKSHLLSSAKALEDWNLDLSGLIFLRITCSLGSHKHQVGVGVGELT